MRIAVPLIAILLIVLIIVGCGDEIAEEPDAAGADEGVLVVTTIFPLADVVAELGGELVEVPYLLPPGASPHTFEPTVEQARLVEQAGLFVYIGAGLDDWAVRLAGESGTGPVMLNLSEEVLLLEAPGHHSLEVVDNDHINCDHDHNHDEDEDCDDDCDHGPDDPHFWLDPITVRDIICPAIYRELINLDPASEAHFKERYEIYRSKLTELHEEIAEATASFSGGEFISFHSAWQYFGSRYNLQELAVIAQFPGQEPSASWLAELIELIKEEEIDAIFAEPQFPAALAERIAEESGSRVLIVDPLGGEDVAGRGSYIDMMRFNLNAFRDGME